MKVSFSGPEDTVERLAEIEALLPKIDFIKSIIEPAILDRMTPIFVKALRAELEVYRAYPKRTGDPRLMIKSFDPRSNKSCFMGKAFKANHHITDIELDKYRKAIGTINHPMWGKVTLLEIWGGDHFVDYNSMVLAAFKYGMGINKNCPTLKFHVNPLYVNKNTGKTVLDEEQKQYLKDLNLLHAQAEVFGARTLKEANAAENKKRRR